MKLTRREMLRTLLVAAAAAPLAACAPAAQKNAPADYMKGLKLAPVSQLTVEVKKSALYVQQAYQFAIANPDVLKKIPCYCGCGGIGHTSNYSCYVKDDSGGKLTLDLHGTGCGICVDITHDTMRMLSQGKTVPQIKAAVDKNYSQYGPSNMSE